MGSGREGGHKQHAGTGGGAEDGSRPSAPLFGRVFFFNVPNRALLALNRVLPVKMLDPGVPSLY
jgi:hypothetical protein